VRPKTILICDDEPNVRQLVRVVLNGTYEFHDASDAEEALRLARRRKPDLVVLDIMVPGDGRIVLDELRKDPELSGTAVVVVTAWPDLEEAVLAAGADRFLSKPFEPDALKAAVDELLEA
jgi:two-component system alkaline phosphatase synthesis response regulator PhoP